MPNATNRSNLPKPLKISFSSGAKGNAFTVRNRTTGEELHEFVYSAGKATVDLQNFPSGFTAGDVIDIIMTGEYVGSTTVTISGDGGQSVTVTTASSTSALARGI